MTARYEDRLAQLNKQWADTPDDAGPPGQAWPEDGDYQAIVDRFDFFESKQDPPTLFLKTCLRITGGKYEGWVVEAVHNLEDPDRFAFTKKHLSALGLDLTELSGLEAALPSVLDVPVEIRVKTSDRKNPTTGEPYRNAYVNKRLGGQVAPDVPFNGQEPVAAPAEDPIEF